jgi:hypothetical protein
MSDLAWQLLPMLTALVACIAFKGSHFHKGSRTHKPVVVSLSTETPDQTLARLRTECEEAEKAREWTMAPGRVWSLPAGQQFISADQLTSVTIDASRITGDSINAWDWRFKDE